MGAEGSGENHGENHGHHDGDHVHLVVPHAARSAVRECVDMDPELAAVGATLDRTPDGQAAELGVSDRSMYLLATRLLLRGWQARLVAADETDPGVLAYELVSAEDVSDAPPTVDESDPPAVSEDELMALARGAVRQQIRWVAVPDKCDDAALLDDWEKQVEQRDPMALLWRSHSVDGVFAVPVPPNRWPELVIWLARHGRRPATIPWGRVVPGRDTEIVGGTLYLIVDQPRPSLFPADDPPDEG